MKRQEKLVIVGAIIGLACIVGCVSSDTHMILMSRSVVERMADDDIAVNGAESMAAMKKERKLQIAVAVDISDQSQGRARPPSVKKLLDSAQTYARSYLAMCKGYRLEAVDMADLNRTLKSGDDIDGVTFPFLVKLKAVLTSETKATTHDDVLEYKCVLQWELIDNRTTGNGLGENPTPVVVESMICQNVTRRKRKLSVTGAAIGGDDYLNAQSAYNIVIGNCMTQFYAQLANRVPFGGVVSGMKTLDGDLYFMIKADAKGQGVVRKMQMLLMNDDHDRIAIGEVLVSANGKSNVKIWRWLSESYRKQIEFVASNGKDEVEKWLNDNPLYALCLGLPELPKDMIRDYDSRR